MFENKTFLSTGGFITIGLVAENHHNSVLFDEDIIHM
jgi:hypothetical protein